MLIVVAIIAILIAVSVPIVSNALERARVATDAANERAAKAELIICYLNETLADGTTAFTPGTVYAYDAANGKIVDSGTSLTGYGKCTKTTTAITTAHNTANILYGTVTATGDVYLQWAASAPSSLTASSNIHNGTVEVGT